MIHTLVQHELDTLDTNNKELQLIHNIRLKLQEYSWRVDLKPYHNNAQIQRLTAVLYQKSPVQLTLFRSTEVSDLSNNTGQVMISLLVPDGLVTGRFLIFITWLRTYRSRGPHKNHLSSLSGLRYPLDQLWYCNLEAWGHLSYTGDWGDAVNSRFDPLFIKHLVVYDSNWFNLCRTSPCCICRPTEA